MIEPTEADHYEVLEVAESSSQAEIKRSYKKLVLTRHPDKDQSNPRAHEAFIELRKSYETISDADSRRNYDLRYQRIKDEWEKWRKFQRQERLRSEDDAKKEKTAEARKKAKEEQEALLKKRRDEQLSQKRGRRDLLQIQLNSCDRKEQRLARLCKGLEAEKKTESGWWSYIFGSQKPPKTESEKTKADQERLQLEAARKINAQKTIGLTKQRDVLDKEIEELVSQEREAEERRTREEARLREQKNREEALRRQKAWQEELERQREEMLKRQRAYEERARKQREEAERQRQQQQAERLAREAAEKVRTDEARRRKRQSDQTPNFQSIDCSHKGWWIKTEGSQTCQECSQFYRGWLLKCPECDMLACAKCRPVLQGRSSSKYNFSQYDFGDCDY